MTGIIEEAWRRLDISDQRRRAERILSEFPVGCSLVSVESHRYAGRERTVASYELMGQPFVLVPGAEVTLGYDASRPYEATAEELESWKYSTEEYGVNPDLAEYLASIAMRPRTVEIPTLLVEVTAQELGWVTLPADEPGIRELAKKEFRRRKKTQVAHIVYADAELRLRRTDDGAIVGERSEPRTPASLDAELSGQGFRFPTPGEWEYLCGAGAPTLFRWGDHAPCDRTPIDMSAEEAAWRKRWLLSRGKLPYPSDGFGSAWDLHRHPNALGLFIAYDPYLSELTADPKVTRGGDGGCAIFGVVGFLTSWLTLATAYFEEHTGVRDPVEPVSAGYTVGRQVLRLG